MIGWRRHTGAAGRQGGTPDGRALPAALLRATSAGSAALARAVWTGRTATHQQLVRNKQTSVCRLYTGVAAAGGGSIDTCGGIRATVGQQTLLCMDTGERSSMTKHKRELLGATKAV